MSANKTQTSGTVVELKKELYLLKMKQLAGELKETHKLKLLRKSIARSFTSH